MEHSKPSTGFLIDGFPREINQVEAFEREIAPVKFILFFDCTEATMEHRLLRRAQLDGHRREEADLKIIKRRLRTFAQTTLPTMQYFIKRDRCISVCLFDLAHHPFRSLPKRPWISSFKKHESFL